MNQELKEIKKKYGEEMAHFCREHFATLLETEGLLSSLLLEHFEPNHELYKDLKENNLLEEFVQYLYSFIEEKEELIDSKETPKELLAKAGYDLYECKTESDIQSFKKYYAKGEELCTFHGGRLETDYVFFAVKKNVDNIKREDFKNPKRQDEYGTSVISIQFDRETNQVSIKNRYNHTVVNPDSTFSNNLDNIIEGLTKSFESVYGFKQEYLSSFEIPDYVMVNGKYYKYNYEIRLNYYCTNNIFIKREEVISYEKERYILFDYYLLDIKEKKIMYLDENINDHFIETIGTIQKIEIEKEKNNKKIRIENEFGNNIEIIINSSNQMVSYTNRDILKINDKFCMINRSLKEIDLPNVENIGEDFCYFNNILEHLNLPKARNIEYNFCYHNKALTKLYLPNVVNIRENFCYSNNSLTTFHAPNLENVDDNFFFINKMLQNLSLPKLKNVGNYFCYNNTNMEHLNLPNLRTVGVAFFYHNHSLKDFNTPNLENIGHCFCYQNNSVKNVNLPKAKVIGDDFLHFARLNSFEAPYLESIGSDFGGLSNIEKLSLPNIQTIGNRFCLWNEKLKILNLPKVKNIGNDFCYYNQTLTTFYAPNLEKVGNDFLKHNVYLKNLIIPKLEKNIMELLNKRMSLDILVLNDKLMNSNYPLVLTYKKNLLLKEKSDKAIRRLT